MTVSEKIDDVIGYVEECQAISRLVADEVKTWEDKYYQWGIIHTCESVLRELRQLKSMGGAS